MVRVADWCTPCNFIRELMFSHQYCSDPVSLAVADAVLTVIEEELQANAKEVGDYLIERLRLLVDKYDRLGDVRYVINNYCVLCIIIIIPSKKFFFLRGYGLFIGLEVVKNKASKEPDGETCVNIVSE